MKLPGEFMASVRATRMLRHLSRPPGKLRAAIGLAGGMLATLGQLFQFQVPGGGSISFTVAVIMMVEMTGGWPAAMVSIVTLTIASMVWHLQPGALLSVTTAVLCGSLLRRGVRPWVAVALLSAAALLAPLLATGVLPRVRWSTLAVLPLEASLNVGSAIALLLLLPRRGAWLVPQRRRRVDDSLYVVATISLAAVVLILNGFGEGSAAALAGIVLVMNLT